MAAYDASYGTPAAARQGLLSSLSDKVSGLFSKTSPTPGQTPTPRPAGRLRPEA
jgi:hypothetical protein